MFSRVPIRLRLALAFAVAMAVLLGAAGLFLRLSLAKSLDDAIDHSLRTRAADVAALVGRNGQGLSRAEPSPATEAGEAFGQVLHVDGRIVDATRPFGQTPLIDQTLRNRAQGGPILIDRARVPGVDDPVRLLATEANTEGLLVVVGASLEDRDNAIENLTGLLFIGGPIALLLASAAGYFLASAALRPVETMRARSARISGAGHGERLPVPPARDEIRRLSETLNEMLGRVDTALARERGFVADASHELRTPLAILKTELELALRREQTPDQLRAAIASAEEETDRLSRLAEDLLTVARSDQGRLAVRREPLDTNTVLETVRARFAERVSREGRTIAVAPGHALSLEADPLRIEQALGNLVDNALSHGAGAVTLSARDGDGAVEMHVLDEGSGVPAAFLPHAFERFSRADPARGRGGAGLGLAIVQAIARAHGGEAHIADRKDRGTDAWFSIPAEPAARRVALI